MKRSQKLKDWHWPLYEVAARLSGLGHLLEGLGKAEVPDDPAEAAKGFRLIVQDIEKEVRRVAVEIDEFHVS
jgi:hypothetical protein